MNVISLNIILIEMDIKYLAEREIERIENMKVLL